MHQFYASSNMQRTNWVRYATWTDGMVLSMQALNERRRHPVNFREKGYW